MEDPKRTLWQCTASVCVVGVHCWEISLGLADPWNVICLSCQFILGLSCVYSLFMFVRCFGLVVSTCQVIGYRKTLWWHIHEVRRLPPQNPDGRERLCVFFSFIWFVYVAMCFSGYSLYILKQLPTSQVPHKLCKAESFGNCWSRNFFLARCPSVVQPRVSNQCSVYLCERLSEVFTSDMRVLVLWKLRAAQAQACMWYFPFSPSTLLVGQQEGHPACNKTGCWFVGGDDLTGAFHDL